MQSVPESEAGLLSVADAPGARTDTEIGGITRIPLAELMPSPTNPRKHFDQAEIQALAANIKAVGLMEPIIVRPLRALAIETKPLIPPSAENDVIEFPPASREKNNLDAIRQKYDIKQEDIVSVEVNDDCGYEIVAGERRYRAHEFLHHTGATGDWGAIDCIVRDLTDAQVLEQQVSENLQREDLDPLDWSNAYEAMVKAECAKGTPRTASVEQVAARLGKSVSVIRQTMQLAKLCEEARIALRKGYISKNHAIDCARLTPERQREYLLEALSLWDVPEEELKQFLESGDEPSKISSVRCMREWIAEEYNDLDEAGIAENPPNSEDKTVEKAEAPREDRDREQSKEDANDARQSNTSAAVSTHPVIPGVAPELAAASEARRKAIELEEKVMRAALGKILMASRVAAKRDKLQLTVSDLLEVAEAMYEFMPLAERTAVAKLLGWKVEESTYNNLLNMSKESRPQFLVACALSLPLVLASKDNPFPMRGVAWNNFAARYKIDLKAIRDVITGEGNPKSNTPATKKAQPAQAKKKVTAWPRLKAKTVKPATSKKAGRK